MCKIAFIGAGSAIFTRYLLGDILQYPVLQDSTIALMDIDPDRLTVVSAMARQMAKQHKLPARVESTLDRREALDGADYVIVTVQVGREEGFIPDIDIPLKYGVKQSIGDTLGPGGVFRALRTVPVVLDICKDIRDLCPGALLINYANPMAMVCWAVNEATSVSCVGLCHSVLRTKEEIAGYIDIPPAEIDCWVAGINHMAWFLRLERNGEDLYPLLRDSMNDKAVYDKDRIRFEMLRYFGRFMTEGSGHLSEYLPYFRRNDALIKRFCTEGFGGETGFFIRFARELDTMFLDFAKQVEGDVLWELKPSGEYTPGIIHAMETGIQYQISGNVANTGLITNLPEGCCVEVPCTADKQGITPCYVGDLPPQLAALNRTNVNVQELAVRAALEQDPELAFQAIALDPLTAAVLSLDEIQAMVDELFEAEKELLPQFSGKRE